MNLSEQNGNEGDEQLITLNDHHTSPSLAIIPL